MEKKQLVTSLSGEASLSGLCPDCLNKSRGLLSKGADTPKLSFGKLAIVLAVGGGLACLSAPVTLFGKTWYILAVFIATIVGFMVQLAPVGALSFIALAIIAALNLAPTRKVLGSFASTTAWTIVCAFLMARGIQKTGLGKRIALNLVRLIGKSTLGLAYALTFAETIMGAAMPSITARSGGVMYPIARGLCDAYDSAPGATAGRLGAYLMQLGHQVACIVSAMFLTGMASNLIVLDLAERNAGLNISWSGWFAAASLPGLVSLLLIPLLLFKLDTPSIQKTPAARRMAEQQLTDMGAFGRSEKIMLAVFLGALSLWASTGFHPLDTTAVAFTAIGVLLATGILSWQDCLTERSCWDSFIWIAALMQMAALIADGGIMSWFADFVAPYSTVFPWYITLSLVTFLYLYTQYFFASLTAHITVLYVPFLLICIASGVPPMLAALVLAMFSNLCGGLTNYSGAHSPIWFSSGYVPQGMWWRNGLVCSLLNLMVFGVVGAVWWKVLRIY